MVSVSRCALTAVGSGMYISFSGNYRDPVRPWWSYFLTASLDQSISCSSPHPPVGLASFVLADEIIDAERFLFLPALSRLAFAFGGTFQVWGAKAPKLLTAVCNPMDRSL